MPNPYYFGQSPDESLGDSPRYFYAIRRNSDGELYLLRSDQLKDKDSIDINLPGPPEETFEDLVRVRSLCGAPSAYDDVSAR